MICTKCMGNKNIMGIGMISIQCSLCRGLGILDDLTTVVTHSKSIKIDDHPIINKPIDNKPTDINDLILRKRLENKDSSKSNS